MNTSGFTTSSSGSSGFVSTGSGTVAFFPLSVGNKWVYLDKLSGEQGTVTNQVISVTPVASGSKVVMKDQDDLGGAAPNTTTSALIAQVRLAGTLQQGPHVLAIPGTGNPGHLAAEVAAAAPRLPPGEMALLESVS